MIRATMRLRRIAIFAVLAPLLNAAPPSANDHVSGRLLVQSRLGANPASVNAAMNRAGAHVANTINRLNVTVLQVPEAAADQVSAALMKTGLFTFVEQDFVARGGATVTPNDPNFPSQWHLPAISAPSAWSVTTGAAGATIAIIDSGVDNTHPDLTSKLVAGWNFLTGTSSTMDDLGHGTAVAGTAAAASNNGVGVTGVAWGNMIMPLVVLDSSDYASYSNIASAITYAADHGARIINISIGGSSASSTLQSAVDYAWNKGAVIFASAMNNSTSTPYYPAACNNVVAVSATESNGTLASFSNYGSWVDLSAPGDYILTTNSGGGYGSWYGTSFSSPISAAVAGLVLSIQPGMSNTSLVSLLESTADPLGGYTGWNQYFGYGQVDAYKAVLAAGSAPSSTTPPAVSISSPASGATISGTVSVQGTAADSLSITNVQFYVDNQLVTSGSASSFSFSMNTVNYANGSHTVKVSATDSAGNVGSASASVNVSNTIPSTTTPPVVTITKPVPGTTISGNLTIAVSATDSLPISQVSIYTDGTLRCTDTTAPYTCSWNTKKVAPGSHTIKATAWDSAGNSASSTITVYK